MALRAGAYVVRINAVQVVQSSSWELCLVRPATEIVPALVSLMGPSIDDQVERPVPLRMVSPSSPTSGPNYRELLVKYRSLNRLKCRPLPEKAIRLKNEPRRYYKVSRDKPANTVFCARLWKDNSRT